VGSLGLPFVNERFSLKIVLDLNDFRDMVHTMNLNAPHDKTDISIIQVRQFAELVNALYQCCQERMQYQSERFGLPDAELRCLMLFEKERYLMPKSIAYKLNVVKSRVTTIVNSLFQKKLLDKISDPGDSRVTLLSATTQGQFVITSVREFQDAVFKTVLYQMEPEQRHALMANLGLLKASMEATKGIFE
jgi:DNA-binding MarR family transcriptional regulator